MERLPHFILFVNSQIHAPGSIVKVPEEHVALLVLHSRHILLRYFLRILISNLGNYCLFRHLLSLITLLLGSHVGSRARRTISLRQLLQVRQNLLYGQWPLPQHTDAAPVALLVHADEAESFEGHCVGVVVQVCVHELV